MTSSPRTPPTLASSRAETADALHAVLADRAVPRHELHLTCDPVSGRLSADFVAADIHGRGESTAIIRRPTPNSRHVVATVAVHTRDDSGSRRSFDVSAALSWTLEPRAHGEHLDVAGTALVYDRAEEWTSRYEVLPDHDGNRFVR